MGYIIGGGVIAVNSAKIHAIIDYPEPTYAKTFKSPLGWLITITGLCNNLQKLLHPYLP